MKITVRAQLGRLFAHVGSKRELAPRIAKDFPKHKKYVELFAGAAHVAFEKEPSKETVLNDIDQNIIGFYKNFSCEALEPCKKIRNVCAYTEKARKRVIKGSKNVCENLAARRFTIVAGVTTGIKRKECAVQKIVTRDLEKNCGVYEKRLKKTKLENMDFRDALKKHDGKNTLFYADPPYAGTFQPYRAKRESVQPEEVCALARKVRGKIVVSYNDTPRVRKACSGRGLYVQSVETRHPAAHVTKSSSKRKELLISNFKPKRRKKS